MPLRLFFCILIVLAWTVDPAAQAVQTDTTAPPVDTGVAAEETARTAPPAAERAAQEAVQTDTAVAPVDTGVAVGTAVPAPADTTAAAGPARPGFIESLQQTEWSLSFGKIFWTLAAFLLAFLIIKYITRFMEAFAERWTLGRLAIKRLVPIVRVVWWMLAVYVIITAILAPPIPTLIALTTSAGIGIGLASQDVLKNIFGGIMILIDRPFQVGDKIETGKYYGEVKQIGLRSVRIVTPDDSLVTIPNGELMNTAVSNANSGESNCQVVAEFFLPPDIDMERARKIAYRAAAVSRYVYLNKPIAVLFKNEIYEMRPMLKMRLKAYVLDIRYEFPFASEMTETVMQELFKAGLVTPETLGGSFAAPLRQGLYR